MPRCQQIKPPLGARQIKAPGLVFSLDAATFKKTILPLPMQAPRIKICCIASAAEARLAVAHGAAALGLVGPMPSGPGVIADSLKPENVREAIETVKPFGLDLCSGVRTHGKLDAVKLAAFFKAAHSAD